MIECLCELQVENSMLIMLQRFQKKLYYFHLYVAMHHIYVKAFKSIKHLLEGSTSIYAQLQ